MRPCRRGKTLLPIEQCIVFHRIFDRIFDRRIIFLRLHPIVAFDFGKHRRSRFSYAHISVAFGTVDDAINIHVGHNEPFRPRMELRAQLRGRRGNVRNRTHKPTPVGAGATIVHHARARLQGSDVLTAGRKNLLALRTHRTVERVLRCVGQHVGHEIAIINQQLRAMQQRTGRTERNVISNSIRAHAGIQVRSAGDHRITHLIGGRTQHFASLFSQSARPWQESLAFQRLKRCVPGVTDHRILEIAGMLAHEISAWQWRANRMQAGNAIFGSIIPGNTISRKNGIRTILNFDDIVQIARFIRSGNDIEHGVIHFLPEIRRFGHLFTLTHGTRITAFHIRFAIGEQRLMAGAGQRHVCETTLVGMQAATIFLALRQIQSVRIDAFHVVNIHGAQGAEHFIIDDFRIFQRFQGLQWIPADERVMGKSRQNIRIHAHRNRHRGGIRQPRFGVFMVFRRRPYAILETIEMRFVNDNAQVIALVTGKSAIGHADHGHGIPFKPLRLVHGHQHHVDGHIGGHRVLFGSVAQRIHP